MQPNDYRTSAHETTAASGAVGRQRARDGITSATAITDVSANEDRDRLTRPSDAKCNQMGLRFKETVKKELESRDAIVRRFVGTSGS